MLVESKLVEAVLIFKQISWIKFDLIHLSFISLISQVISLPRQQPVDCKLD